MPTLEELETEITALQERLKVTTALAEAMRAYEASVGKKVHGTGNLTVRHRATSGRASPAMMETERAATDLMVRTGAPAPTSSVVQEMVNQGMSIPPQNAVNVISARLSNNPKFKARRGVGYWLADRPWPGDEEIREQLGLNEIEATPENTEDASNFP